MISEGTVSKGPVPRVPAALTFLHPWVWVDPKLAEDPGGLCPTQLSPPHRCDSGHRPLSHAPLPGHSAGVLCILHKERPRRRVLSDMPVICSAFACGRTLVLAVSIWSRVSLIPRGEAHSQLSEGLPLAVPRSGNFKSPLSAPPELETPLSPIYSACAQNSCVVTGCAVTGSP